MTRVGNGRIESHFGMQPARLVFRLTWIALRLLLVAWAGQKGAYFVYQGF